VTEPGNALGKCQQRESAIAETGGVSDELRLLPAEVLPEAERRAWSRRHPVRVSLGRSLLVTPFVAVVVVLAPGVSWGLRVVGIALAALVAFVVSWCAVRVQTDHADDPVADF
jgi:hypothetical protein